MIPHEASESNRSNPVIRYLIRECRYCGGIMKLQTVNGKIIHLEGCAQTSLFKPHLEDGRTVIFVPSHKTVRCINRGKGNPLAQCDRMAQVGRFQEISS